MRRTTLLGAGLATVLAAVPLATLAPAQADRADRADRGGHGPGTRETVRFSTFNASLNRAIAGELRRRPVHPGRHRAGAKRGRDHPAHAPGRLLVNEFDFDPAAVDLFRDNFLEVGAERRARRSTTPTRTSRRPTPASRAASTSTTTACAPAGRRRRLRLRAVPRPVRHGRLLEVPDRHGPRSAPSRTSGGRTCPARCCPTTRRRRRRPTGTRPRSWRTSGSPRKSHWDVPIEIGARPCTSWSRTRRRPPSTEPRTATAPATTTRSASGPTTSRRQAAAAYIYDDAGTVRRAGAGRDVRDRRRPERRPGRRRLGRRRDRAAARPPAGQRPAARRPRGGRRGAVDQGGANLGHEGDPALDTADFADGAPGNLRVDYVLPSKADEGRRVGHLLAGRRPTRCTA